MKRAQMLSVSMIFIAELVEAPLLIGVDNPSTITIAEPVIEVDDARNKARREDAHAAEIEQVDPRPGDRTSRRRCSCRDADRRE